MNWKKYKLLNNRGNMLKKINYIFNLQQKKKLIILAGLSVIGSVFELIGVSAVLPLISVIIAPDVLHTNSLYATVSEILNITEPTKFVLFMGIILIFLYIIKNVFLIFLLNYRIKFDYSCRKDVSVRLMNCYIHQDYLYHVSKNVADLQRNVSLDVAKFFQTVTAFMNLFIEALTVILLAVYLLIVDPYIAIALFALLGTVFVFIMRIYKKHQVKAGIIAREASSTMSKWILQSFSGIKEIKVTNREKFFLDNYSHAQDISNATNARYNKLSGYPKYILETISICGLLGIIIVRIMLGVDITEFAVSLSAFAVAAMRMLPSFNRITEYMSLISFGKASTDNVYNDLKEVEKLEKVEKQQITNIEKIQLNSEIKISELTFSYPENNKLIFDKASVEIKKNQSVAFIGESGAGKTTLADIILGLLQPKSGIVEVDGINVFTHLDAWHKCIGYIPQSIYLMDGTIKENILFGIDEKDTNDEQLWKSIKEAQLEEFVLGLKDGVNTPVGDRGVRLSGGQRQRVGIARALYLNPDILVLDEATSALDNETEQAVMQSIDSLQGNITLIIIAHRLTTIRNCDCIYEICDGKIISKNKNELF